MANARYCPTPLFDTLENIKNSNTPKNIDCPFAQQDFKNLKDFLLQYTGSQDTYIAYRRECERLAQWAWFVAKKSLLELRRADIEQYIAFCQNPPRAWIGTKKVARFIIQCFSHLPHILPREGLKTFTSPKSTESDLNHWR